MLCTRKAQPYLGVWARVKRRLWTLMLRFIISFRKSSGEFRGDPRGESLGEILGEPPGEAALDLGMSLTSLVNLWSCGMSSTSDSSELSVHSSLMAARAERGVGLRVHLGFGWTATKEIQTVLNRLFCSMTLFSPVPLELSPQVLSWCSYVWANPGPVHARSKSLFIHTHWSLSATWSDFHLYWKSFFCTRRDHPNYCATRKIPQTLTFMSSLCRPPSCMLCWHYCWAFPLSN